MNADWKDMLAGLKESLPEGESHPGEGESPCTPESDANAGTSRSTGTPRREKLAIFMERKGRGGKTATIITGFQCGDEELKEVAARLKNKMGTGGSARGGEILLQGDCRERLRLELRQMGYQVK